MRSTFALMLLLLLSIWIHDARGIRLRKASVPSDRKHSVHEEGGGRRSNGEEEEGIVCRSKKCSTGRIRKLSMIHIPSTTTNTKNEEMKMEGDRSSNIKVENVSANSWSEAEPYPDTIDVAGMDYSLQARRRPPIHN